MALRDPFAREERAMLAKHIKRTRELEAQLYKRDCQLAEIREELKQWKARARKAEAEAERHLVTIASQRRQIFREGN
jgi:hypothetical protein